MKFITFLFSVSMLSVTFGIQLGYAQEDIRIPPVMKTIEYAHREITFSEVVMNGQPTTYLAVEKGETVTMKTRITSERIGDYCPACIVQVYWGIRDYTSVCAKSFGGYRFTKKKSKHTFQAPMKDGIYYITMGGSLEYSCKNNTRRPNCSSDYAFAVLRVGNPDFEKKITFEHVKTATSDFLKTSVVKSGAFGVLHQTDWFFEGEQLAYENQQEIPLTKFGTYTAVWSNCLTKASDSIRYTSKGLEEISPLVVEDTPLPTIEKASDSVDSDAIAVLLEQSDSFVLKHLVFDLNEAVVRPESKDDLNILAEVMKAKPSMRILLEGHTAIGNARKNMLLSERRVASTKTYLVAQGVQESTIETKGWGQQKPLVHTRNKARGKINRRVEISILAR